MTAKQTNEAVIGEVGYHPNFTMTGVLGVVGEMFEVVTEQYSWSYR